ncbi:hypothetical protein DLAC_01608 [Tieghemostelium lacteum]|uniref:Uncharacterized protein n=1 Tax=Tieghemostelium lacteum TaxID=361077 RepID=A0A152A5U6_TIELA|nr:hypothetical protein DLAC_01608 [Tieghemostelium lacteum]|eukprot:KYR01609.1 hypothetical protein DLAC_01608 [Tieghemostelium lacteum]
MDQIQAVFNNKFIRLKILNSITRIIDLLRLMFTSSRMMTLIKSTLPTMIITLNLNKIMRKNMVEIIKYFSVVHKLVLDRPKVECILQLKSIDILELQYFNCPKDDEDSVLQHLSTVVNDELILNNYQITTINNNNIESLKGIYQRVKRLHLDGLSSQFMKFDNYDHIISLKTTCITNSSSYFQRITPIETIPVTLPTYIPQFLSQKHFSSLQELCLNSISINDEILLNLSKSSKLKILSLKNSDRVTDVGLIALCHQLSKLVVYNLSEITDRSLSHCFMLRDLFISKCPKVRGDCFQILCNTLESIDLGKSLKYIQPNKYFDSYQCFSKIPKVKVSIGNYDIENDWDPVNPYSHLPLLTHIDEVHSSSDLTDEILSQFTRIQSLRFGTYGYHASYTDQGIKQMIENRDPNAGVIEFFMLDSNLITDLSLQYLSQVPIQRLAIHCKITAQGMKYLNGIDEIDLNLEATDEHLKNIPNVKALEFWSKKDDVTATGISYLSNLRFIRISYPNFPLNAFQHLSTIDTLFVDEWEDPIPFHVTQLLKGLVEVFENGDCNFLQPEDDEEDSENKLFLLRNGVSCQSY